MTHGHQQEGEIHMTLPVAVRTSVMVLSAVFWIICCICFICVIVKLQQEHGHMTRTQSGPDFHCGLEQCVLCHISHVYSVSLQGSEKL